MKKIHIGIWLSIFVLAFFTIWFILKQNYEFLTYTITIGLLIYLIAKTDKVFRYSNFAKWGFAVWLFSHLAGGSFTFRGERLYDLMIYPWIGDPFFILRYDQVVHFFCYFVITFFVYAIVRSIIKEDANKITIGFIAFLAGIGVGAINEIIEFATVAFFQATGVGGYYNNALDLVFNALGTLVSVLIANKEKRK